MNYLTKGAIIGIILVIVLSLVLSPFLCNSIRIDNPDVKCKGDYYLTVSLRMYSSWYTLFLVVLGCISGMFISRLAFLICNREIKEEQFNKEVKNKNYSWIWEN